jgi:hypothetical protein
MSKNALMLVFTLTFVFSVSGKASAPPLANPVLYFIGQELYESAGKQFVRYSFDVLNKDIYPDDMFAAAPDLPPCGSNTKAARTWVDVYDQSGHRLQGFCNLGKSSDLGKLWFGLAIGDVPPSWVYIELNDRKTATKYKSNLADTTL